MIVNQSTIRATAERAGLLSAELGLVEGIGQPERMVGLRLLPVAPALAGAVGKPGAGPIEARGHAAFVDDRSERGAAMWLGYAHDGLVSSASSSSAGLSAAIAERLSVFVAGRMRDVERVEASRAVRAAGRSDQGAAGPGRSPYG